MATSPRPRQSQSTPPGVSRDGSPLIPTHGSPGVPHSVWLPPESASHSPAIAGSVLPGWALHRACAQFAPAGGPAALLLLPGPDFTERTARPADTAPGWLAAAQPVDLADAGRARLALALLLADPALGTLSAPEHLPGFFAEIRAALRPGAPLLIHTHPLHTKDGMRDPAGDLLAAARTAGFAYIQHLVIVHHPLAAVTKRPRAARRAADLTAAHRRVHTDLYQLADNAGGPR